MIELDAFGMVRPSDLTSPATNEIQAGSDTTHARISTNVPTSVYANSREASPDERLENLYP
jgi:hypothetical protein